MIINKNNIDAIAAGRRRRQRLLAMADDGTTVEETPAVDKYLWTWDAVGQHTGNLTYSFTSTAADDSWIGTGIVFTANDGGVQMAQFGTTTDKHGGITNTAMLWDISEEHLFKQDGITPTSSGPLDHTVTVDGDHITFIYSHSYLGQGNDGSWDFGKPGTGPGTAKFFWTQAAVTATGPTDGGEYSSGISLSSVNIEGDDIYLTYKVKGTTAVIDASPFTLAWEDASSDPRILEDNPWGNQSISAETHVLFRGAILWNSTTSAKGNTGVTFPIFDDSLSP